MAAEPNHQELIIIKRHGGHGDGHHGGAWKIAFADFMTAMMALFLVLWLISATNPKQKIIIAHYFNPVKLAEVSVNKKGLDDPSPSEGGRGGLRLGESGEKRLELPPQQEKRALFDQGEAKAVHDEAALFRDPYAVLSEIAAEQQGEKSKLGSKDDTPGTKPDPILPESNDTFRDPFSTAPAIEPPSSVANNKTQPPTSSKTADAVAEALAETSDQNAAEKASATPSVTTPAVFPVADSAHSEEKEKTPTPTKEAVKNPKPTPPNSEQQAADRSANEAEAVKLRSEIVDAMDKDAISLKSPNVEVKSTAEGVLISLTDENTYAMFAVGSAEPQPKTIEVMEKVAQLLKNYPGLIVIRGHTDGRPYKSATYDNWQLSAARAQMAHYMLVHGGLDEKRIDRIEGYADHQLKLANDPLAAENRRIEILLRKEKP